MSVPHAHITFPGIDPANVRRVVFTLSHGVSPSSGTLELIPQVITESTGSLLLSFGDDEVTFRDCQIVNAFLRRSGAGIVMDVQLVDRRWKWAYGEIDGWYNRRKPDDTIDPTTEKTPQELATLLLEAGGESNFSVDELPDDTRPEEIWDSDNPFLMLANLCDSLGCRVVLGLDNKVRIRRLGEGDPLPDIGAQTNESFGVNALQRPDNLKLVCGPTRYQAKFKLEAVGLDNDGKIKLIDDLSYTPSAGWEKTYYHMISVADEEDRDLAIQTVFRWYRIKTLGDGTLQVPGGPLLKKIQQVLPLESGLVEPVTDPDNVEVVEPPRISGVYWAKQWVNENNEKGKYSDLPFSVNTELGIVQFSEPVLEIDDATHKPARLLLEIGFSVRDDETWIQEKHSKEVPVPGQNNGTKPQIIDATDIQKTVIAAYEEDVSNGCDTVIGIADNLDEIDLEIQSRLDNALAQFQDPESVQISYVGLVPIEPDGAIQQIGWQLGPGGIFTTASRSTEYEQSTPSYWERRQVERLASP